MAIVIGAATTVNFMSACVISANWGYSPNPQRLYCVGKWEPDAVHYRPTENMSLSIYAPGNSYDTAPTVKCEDANTVAASIDPEACGGTFSSVTGNWMVTSYGFSKEDSVMPGQETWGLQKWKGVSGATVDPTHVLRGIAEGQGTDNAGVVFKGTTVEATTGSVSANALGRADTIDIGIVSSVGGGSSTAGDTGQGSASISYTPLYI